MYNCTHTCIVRSEPTACSLYIYMPYINVYFSIVYLLMNFPVCVRVYTIESGNNNRRLAHGRPFAIWRLPTCVYV